MKILFIIGLICSIVGSIYTIINFICLYKLLNNNSENYNEKIAGKLTHIAIGGIILGIGLGWLFDIL